MGKNIIVLGNSVAAVAKPQKKPNLTYSNFLDQEKLTVTNFSFRASMISDDMFSEIPNVQNTHILILNFGVVEACTRPINRKFYKFLYQSEHNNAFVKPLVKLITTVESKLRPWLVKIRGYKPWMPASEFEKYMKSLISDSRKVNPDINFIGITINKPSSRIENQLPKSHESIKEFNKVYHRLAQEFDFPLFDSYNQIKSEYIPDGIHYNTEGHKIVAERINEIISKDNNF